MPSYPFNAADLAALCAWDTPTICNALEVTNPERRGFGFTVRQFAIADVTLPPICGLARVGTIRAAAPSGRSREEDRAVRLGWYEYVGAAAMPTVVVLEDLDPTPGIGAFWGEVNSNVHKGLGALGCVTSGSIRDLDMLAPGFQLIAGSINPSHAHVHNVAFGAPVNVHGMAVATDDVVHADRHGAVVIPADSVKKIPGVIDLLTRKEAVILAMARGEGFNAAMLREAFRQADDIH